jgi:hypothetical protein
VNSKAHKWNIQVTANRDELKVITTKYYEHFLFRMQRHVTIELLTVSITNDVLYIHHGQDAIAHGGELTDQVLALSIARLSREPRLHHSQVLTLPKLGCSHGRSGP